MAAASSSCCDQKRIDKMIDSILEEGEEYWLAGFMPFKWFSYVRDDDEHALPSVRYSIEQILMRIRDSCIAASYLARLMVTPESGMTSLVFSQCLRFDRSDVCEILVSRCAKSFRHLKPDAIEKTWTAMTREMFEWVIRCEDPPGIRLDLIPKFRGFETLSEFREIRRVFTRLTHWKFYIDMVCGIMSIRINGTSDRIEMCGTEPDPKIGIPIDPLHLPNRQGIIDDLYTEFTPRLRSKHPYLLHLFTLVRSSSLPICAAIHSRFDKWASAFMLQWDELHCPISFPPTIFAYTADASEDDATS